MNRADDLTLLISSGIMVIAAIITVSIWSSLIYSSIHRNEYGKTMRFITVLILFFVWFILIWIQNRASSNYELYNLSLILGYFILVFVLISLWRAVLTQTREPLRLILKTRSYQVLFIGTIITYGLFYFFASGMISFTNPDELITPNGFFKVMKSHGLLTAWPAITFGWPAVHLSGILSIDALLLMMTMAGLMGISIVMLVYGWRTSLHKTLDMKAIGSTAGSSITVAALSFSCCSLPVLYPFFLLFVSSTVAESMAFQLVSESGLLFSLIQMAVLSLMSVTTISMATRFQRMTFGICEINSQKVV